MWPPHEATPSSGRRKRQSASEGGWEPRDRKPIHYRTDPQADCADCFGLCCVALPFARSADFAVNKPAGKPCSNLQSDVRCGIHAARGFQTVKDHLRYTGRTLTIIGISGPARHRKPAAGCIIAVNPSGGRPQ